MPTSSMSDAERAILAERAYRNPETGKVDFGSGYKILDQYPNNSSENFSTNTDDKAAGLEIYAVQKVGTNEVVFVVRGTDSEPNAGADWNPIVGANVGFGVPSDSAFVSPQLMEAVEFVNKFIKNLSNQDQNFIYSTAGHSKGGGFGQVLSYTFGFEGTGLDSAPAANIINSLGYQKLLDELGIDQPAGLPDNGFVNYIERGSLVGDYLQGIIGGHLGAVVPVDLVPGSIWSGGIFNVGQGVLDQHNVDNFVRALNYQGEDWVIERSLYESYQIKQQIEQRIQQIEEKLSALNDQPRPEGVGEEVSLYQTKRSLTQTLEEINNDIASVKELLQTRFGYTDEMLDDNYLGLLGGPRLASDGYDPDYWDAIFAEAERQKAEREQAEKATAEQGQGLTIDDIDLAIQQYFTALNVTQSIDALANALKHGDVVDQLNALANLALSIDRYCDANFGKPIDQLTEQDRNEHGLTNEQAAWVHLAASVTTAIQAFRGGDDLDKLAATLQLSNDIIALNNSSFNGIPALGTAVAAINTYQSARAFNDALHNGDDMAIAQSGVNLAYSAGTLYNGVAWLMNASEISGVEYLGYAAAVLQIMDGKYEQGTLNLVGTAMVANGDGWVKGAGFAILIANALFGESLFGDGPPTATAWFGTDDNGQVFMEVGGDKEARGAAAAYGNPMIELMQNWADSGGRLWIPGEPHLPRIVVTAGERPVILYGGEYGRVSVAFDTVGEGINQMFGVLAARDRGAAIDEAIKVSMDAMGNIDAHKFDAYLFSLGFEKHGATYTFGEDTSVRTGHAVGTGIFAGGGNVGPEGQVFTATSITSLPLKPEQLPSQKMGEITEAASLDRAFTGAGAGLLVAAMIAEGLDVQTLAAATIPTTQSGDAPTPALPREGGGSGAAAEESPAEPPTLFEQLARFDNPEAVSTFLETNWNALQAEADTSGDFHAGARSAYFYTGSDVTGQTAIAPHQELPVLGDDSPDQILSRGGAAAETASSQSGGGQPNALPSSFYTSAARSFSGYATSGTTNSSALSQGAASTEAPVGPPAEPPILGVSIGARFVMAEDTALRFLATNLTAETAMTADRAVFAGFGEALHGRVWQEANGDIRFQPDAGFYGQASFSYFIENPDGTVEERQALITVENVNHAPEPQDDLIELHQGEVLWLDTLLANDSDKDGDALVLDHVRGLSHGEIKEIDGRLAFVPDLDFTGEITLSYFVRDHYDAYPSRAEATIRVLEADTPVVTVNDRFLIREGEELLTDAAALLKNDREFDDGIINFIGVSKAAHGIVAIDEDGVISFQSEQGYIGGEAGFYYQVSDSSGNLSEGWVSVGIVDVRHAPEAIAAGLTINEGESLIFDAETLAKFVFDQDGDALFLESLTGLPNGLPSGFPTGFPSRVATEVTGGTVTVAGGLYQFTPEAGFTGTTSFFYRINDGFGGVVEGELEITVAAVDKPPVLGADEFTTEEEQAIIIDPAALLANDYDPEGGKLVFAGLGSMSLGSMNLGEADLDSTNLGGAKHGTVSMSEDGRIEFMPDKDYFGDEAGFFYRVQDEAGNVSEAWVKIGVTNVNDVPEIIADTLQIDEDEVVALTPEMMARFIYDADGETFTVTAISNITGGTVEERNGVFHFIPDPNYHGPASFDYTAINESGEEVKSSLALDIQPVDDPTEYTEISLTTNEEEAVSVTVADLLAAATDADGNLSFLAIGEVKHGTVSVSEGGQVEFMPDKDYFGDEAGFFYRLQDADGNESESFVKIAVANVNDVPEIIADSLTINEDESFVLTPEMMARFIYDADGDEFFVSEIDNITGGRVEEKDGLFRFVPDENYYGPASLSYTAKSVSGDEIAGVIHLTINPVNDLPDAGPVVERSGIEDTEITVAVADLLAQATDVEDGAGAGVGGSAGGSTLTAPNFGLRFAGIDSTIHGDAWVDADNVLHFLPDDDFFGTALLRYRIADSEGGIGYGYISFSIEGVQDAPVAEDDEIRAWSNPKYEHAGEIYENVFAPSIFLDNDRDPDGDILSIVSVSAAAHGAVSLDAAGNIHYTAPAENWVGIDSFTYTISDGQGGEAWATVTLEVKPNTSPDLRSEVLWSQEDIISILGDEHLLANDKDIDGDSLRIIAVDQAEHCTVELLQDGTVRFTPELNYNNNYPELVSFRYTVSDGVSAPVSAIAYVNLDPVNDAPILTSEVLSGAKEDNVFIFTPQQLLANDWDVEMNSPYETDSIHFAGVWGAAHGSISYQEKYTDKDGHEYHNVIVYIPNENYNNPKDAFDHLDLARLESFYYAIADDDGAVTIGQSYIYVEAVNDAPVVEYDYASGIEDSVWTRFSIASLLANDYDPDGDTLTIRSPYVVKGSGGDIGRTYGGYGGTFGVVTEVKIEGGYLWVQPGFTVQEVTVRYLVDDGHGGVTESYLYIDKIKEHQYAPAYVGSYIEPGSVSGHGATFIFRFMDKNKDLANMGISLVGGATGVSKVSAKELAETKISDVHRDLEFSISYVQDGSGTMRIPFTVTGVDAGGRTGTVLAWFNGTSLSIRNLNGPIIFDLDGDGVELLAADEGVAFDWDGDGVREITGWVSRDDAFLAYDFDGDGRVTMAAELSFRDYLPGALTDLEGLRAFDTNGDGIFDASDEKWASFGLWQDINGNGICDDGEFRTLDEAGIASLSLQSDGQSFICEGNVVQGLTTYTTVDGALHIAGDVGLVGEEIALTLVTDEDETAANDGDLLSVDSLTDTDSSVAASDGTSSASLAATDEAGADDSLSAVDAQADGQEALFVVSEQPGEGGTAGLEYAGNDYLLVDNLAATNSSSVTFEETLPASDRDGHGADDFLSACQSGQADNLAASDSPFVASDETSVADSVPTLASLGLDEAMLNNIACQLASDMAASAIDETPVTTGSASCLAIADCCDPVHHDDPIHHDDGNVFTIC